MAYVRVGRGFDLNRGIPVFRTRIHARNQIPLTMISGLLLLFTTVHYLHIYNLHNPTLILHGFHGPESSCYLLNHTPVDAQSHLLSPSCR
jgi:hypothetical protein